MTVKMYYSARWDTPKEKTWSGTTWHLRQVLSGHFDITDFEIPGPGLVGKVANRLRRKAGQDDMGLTSIREGSHAFWKKMNPQPGDVVFSFDECPMPDKLRGGYFTMSIRTTVLSTSTGR